MELAITNEEILIAKLKNNDNEAYNYIVNSYKKKLINIANKIINDEEASKDIVQEVLLDFYRSVGRFNGKSSIYTYLYRITVNKSIDALRKIIASKKLNLIKNESDKIETTETRIIVNKALEKLNDDLKIPLLMVEYEGLKYEEIALILGLPVETIKMRIFYARKKLLKIFNNMGYKL
jgi:RNA polymerase sigma-70 factor (ECF subfamily)